MCNQRRRNILKLHKALNHKGFYISTNNLDPLSQFNENRRMVNWQDKVLRVAHRGNWLHVPISYYYSLDENSDWMAESIATEFALCFDASVQDTNDAWFTPSGLKLGVMNTHTSQNSVGKTHMWIPQQLTGVPPTTTI